MLRLRSLALALLLTTAAPAGVTAGAFAVSPTRVQLAPDQRAAVVTLQNNAAEPVTVQVQTFAWPHGGVVRDLEPTRELLAMPAVLTLPPKEKQIIRVALRSAPAGSTEMAYRLLITEVPSRPSSKTAGIRFALRLSLPVFVTPKGAEPEPAWSAGKTGGKPQLQLTNNGNAHLQIKRITLKTPGRSQPLQVIEDPAYVLAGRQQTWPLKASLLGQEVLSLKAETNLGEIEATVVPSRG